MRTATLSANHWMIVTQLRYFRGEYIGKGNPHRQCCTNNRVRVPLGLRKCLKSVFGSSSNIDMGAPKVVFHEQREISKRPERQRMAILGTVAACSQTSRPADQIPAQGGGERYSLCVAHRMRMANAPSRPASVAHHVPLLPHMASRWDHGADT